MALGGSQNSFHICGRWGHNRCDLQRQSLGFEIVVGLIIFQARGAREGARDTDEQAKN